jgi:hypothetical protein
MRLAATFAAARRGLSFLCLLASAGGANAQNNHATGWVVIPVTEYATLRQKASPATTSTPHLPLEATLSRVDYSLRVDGEVATGQAALTIDVLRDGWAHVPIPEGLMPRDARIDGKLVSLVHGATGLSALLSARGRSVLKIDMALPVTSAGGEERLTLPAGASGVTRATLTVTRPGLDMKVTGGLVPEHIEGETDTRWVAYARGNQPITFAWHRKMEEQKRSPLTLRMRGTLGQSVVLGEEATQVSAEVALEVMQGAAHSARVRLPAGITINNVAGPNVGDWERKGNDLTVAFLDPVEQRTAFVISAEVRLPRAGAIELPLLQLADLEREAGGIAVEVEGAGEIRNLRSKGLERVEPAELGGAIASRQSPSLLAFRFRMGGGERALGVDVTRYTQQAVLTANVEEARYRALITSDGKNLVEARYAVRNNQRNFLHITLPAGATLWSASLGGRPVRPGSAADGSLLLPLAKAAAGEDAPLFVAEVVYLVPGTAWTASGRTTLKLPTVDLPISRTGILLYHPPQHRVTVEPGSFRMEPIAPPGPAALESAPAPEANPSALLPVSPAQQLIDRYRVRRDAFRPAESTPMRVEFPAMGPSIFLAGELTAENQVPSVDLTYRGVR